MNSISCVSYVSLSVVLLFLTACGQPTQKPAESPAVTTSQSAQQVKLISLHPDETAAGVVFNIQKDGGAGLAVKTEGARNTTAIVFAGQRLDTVFGGETLLSTEVPAALYSKPGKYEVHLQTGDQRSNVLIFEVR